MKGGRIVAEGSPAETLNPEIMEEVYGVRARVEKDSHGFNVHIESAI
jgi:ABC-type cobalamin/Fe3+-siderophores transport system ATPase subunit